MTARSPRWRSPRTGALAVSGGSDRTVRVWDLATSAERAVLAGHAWPGVVGSHHPWTAPWRSAEAVTAPCGSGTWPPGREEAVLTGHAGEVFSVALTPDGTLAVSGSGDGTVRVWDVPAGEQKAILTGHTGWVRAVMVAADGTLAISGGEDASVRGWDWPPGGGGGPHRPSGEVFSVAITPGGARALSGSGDETLREWDPTATAGRPRHGLDFRGSG